MFVNLDRMSVAEISDRPFAQITKLVQSTKEGETKLTKPHENNTPNNLEVLSLSFISQITVWKSCYTVVQNETRYL